MYFGYYSLGELLLNVIFKVLMVVLAPVYLLFIIVKWFTLSAIKEAGNRLVQFTGGVIAISVIGLAMRYFIN